MSSRRFHAQTLNRLAAELGDDSPLGCLDDDRLSAAMLGAWGACAPATWNRHVATARSFVAFCQRRDALPMLMAKSRHTSLRSLQKYARLSADAVAALTAAHDPERRRR